MDERGEIRRNLVNPPLKDTVMVPDGGFTVLRFLADNPGYWLVHCHMSWHNHLGMGFVIKVMKHIRGLPLMMSTKIFAFVTPSPSLHFGTDFY